ncbi:hypothetical protein AVEN_42485-1 [Araneus ventricosus]|uniref:ATP-dependent DNA helicase n=1 Tax=Araneus ventricosus TaxID=182803 RepID=A0A4Y2TS06_ARAVE|nr:hypothetical protein AVEN_42485-1 [Araneus ventricosus]
MWEKFKNDMADDIFHRLLRHDKNIEYNDVIYNEALSKVEDQVITITGKNLSSFGLSRPSRTNESRKKIFDNVLKPVESGEGGLYFLDAPGGTGKTFLLNILLVQIRKDKKVAIAVSSSGIAATLLDSGRTAHSVLTLPLYFAHEETPICNFTKNSERCRMLQKCKLLVWDECTLSHKRAVEALNRTMKDINNNQSIMGEMVLLMAGDFRQILSVITRGTPADEINACLKASPLWEHVKKFNLTTNMRVQLFNDTESGEYAAILLKIGEGRFKTDPNSMITLNGGFCEIAYSTEKLISKVYQELQAYMGNREWLCERAIFAPTNEIVAQINEKNMSQVEGSITEYLSVMDNEQVTSYPVEFLDSLEMSGVPRHKLRLKIGVPVLSMRNLNTKRLCNGVRLQITHLGSNIVRATLLTGIARGENVLIPRIPIIPTDLPFQFKRLQFPLKPVFGMTINKAQGQTIKVACVHLEKPCFSQGQLYVACSRVSSTQNLYIPSKSVKPKIYSV